MFVNLLRTMREGRIEEYWLEVVAVRTERTKGLGPNKNEPRANIPQSSAEQVKSVSCSLYGIVSLSDRTLLRLVKLSSANFER